MSTTEPVQGRAVLRWRFINQMQHAVRDGNQVRFIINEPVSDEFILFLIANHGRTIRIDGTGILTLYRMCSTPQWIPGIYECRLILTVLDPQIIPALADHLVTVTDAIACDQLPYDRRFHG